MSDVDPLSNAYCLKHDIYLCDACGTLRQAFKCPQCEMTSYNLNDIKNQYCGNCHEFLGDKIYD